jgi:hypothetical protein
MIREVDLKIHIRRMHSPDGIVRQKKEEMRVERALIAAGYEKVALGDASPPPRCFSREHRVDFRCLDKNLTWATIDFVVTLANGQTVLLEVDEQQHRFGYGEAGCDMRRIARVHESLVSSGFVAGLQIVRYNPHAFKIAGKTARTMKTVREASLVAYLERAERLDDGQLRIGYMFYDRAHEDSPRPLVCDDPDFHSYVAEVSTVI